MNMGMIFRRLFVVLASAFLAAVPAQAVSEVDLLSPDTVILAGDVRMVEVGGERSWIDDGFGKLRFGSFDENRTSDGRIRAALGSADFVWQPKLGWALSATVVGRVQQRDRTEAGLSEAYLTFKPLGDEQIKFSGRAGLMWPPVSLEHNGPEWAVRDTITPSAINSWIGEEVKFVGAEATATSDVVGGKLSVTAAIVDANDTAGALLAFRGWALHDIDALAWRKQPLPVLSPAILDYQPRYSHPLMEIDGGFLKRPGWFARIAWQLRAPIKIETIHYDNGSDPESYDANSEWGWRTRFTNIGLTALVAPATELRIQALQGRTKMGFVEDGRRYVDMRFRSAFALVTRRFGKTSSISARAEAFDTRNRGEYVTGADDEHGWAATLAGKHALGRNANALIELLHIEGRREARLRVGLDPRQAQTQFQMALRLHW